MFQNEKIGDTKTKLHELMNHIPEPGGKSLLLQTLALFETLLSKIQTMKTENETMSAENGRLTSCLQTKCDVEDNLKQTEDKLVTVNEVKYNVIKYFTTIRLKIILINDRRKIFYPTLLTVMCFNTTDNFVSLKYLIFKHRILRKIQCFQLCFLSRTKRA